MERTYFQGEGGEGAAELVPHVDVRRPRLHALQRPRNGLQHPRSSEGKKPRLF